jgi:3-deoxy-D-manno-octulosonic acid kinase
VPRPAAARYVRNGLTYRADLITVRIPGIRPLSDCVLEKRPGTDFWLSVGGQIREFHAAGVCHADMNAFNLQIDQAGRLWMLDLDRGRLLGPGPWQQRTLARLHRSFEKIKARDPRVSFAAEDWDRLLAGYFDASRSA